MKVLNAPTSPRSWILHDLKNECPCAAGIVMKIDNDDFVAAGVKFSLPPSFRPDKQMRHKTIAVGCRSGASWAPTVRASGPLYIGFRLGRDSQNAEGRALDESLRARLGVAVTNWLGCDDDPTPVGNYWPLFAWINIRDRNGTVMRISDYVKVVCDEYCKLIDAARAVGL